MVPGQVLLTTISLQLPTPGQFRIPGYSFVPTYTDKFINKLTAKPSKLRRSCARRWIETHTVEIGIV